MANVERSIIQQEALSRATTGQSWSNCPAIFEGFIARGIPEDEIRPRENVLTFEAWKALGRHVRRGEHGVRVVTWIETAAKVDPATGREIRKAGRRPWSAVVFHVSQTEPNNPQQTRAAVKATVRGMEG